ncbi:alpha-2,8-sialyltransferase 8E-like [Malaclemys terrapin pileata]|uniref:alpha-2,8-sialyltransferase 8E-like n=1 Tax=Malaclemys terrapin pileata TaxID=2991368 RepID=UPI0023A8E0D6|nr:alpha-2,8-sialyltransferase 8E-like [Malaclemys terrapin pileata]XP_053861105.1 alpha-2,8-sialyltransferase 8E-like [Malaclemys terrapin pileata]
MVGPPRMLRRRSWALVLCVSISFSFSVLWKLQSRVSQLKIVLAAGKGARRDPKHPCRPMDQNRSPIPEAPVMGAEQCRGLVQNWSAGTLPARLDQGWILRQLKLVQRCPWVHNASALGQYREQLGSCCNASDDLVLTQNNTQLGSQIVYDAQRNKKHPVKEELLEMLPQVSPFQGAPYECCAVVGNGGILRNSGCGPEIDHAQFVIRFNLPPMDFADDVGTKSSVVTMNPSILHARFRGLSRWRRPFAEVVGAYGAPLLLIPAFSFVGQSTVSFQALYTLEDFGSPARAIFMNPEYLARLDGHWRSRGLRAKRLSSGFMLVNAALELCQHLTLYGFWPFPTDPEGRLLPHHYYDNQPPKPGVHTMPDEFTRYVGMHMQGALRLHLGRCW